MVTADKLAVKLNAQINANISLSSKRILIVKSSVYILLYVRFQYMSND